MEPAQQYPGLDDFLAALRFEGIPIAPHELGWLQHAFRLAPSLDRQSLKDLLVCTMIKQASHREVFEALFEDWCPPDEAKIAKPSAGNDMPSTRTDANPTSISDDGAGENRARTGVSL